MNNFLIKIQQICWLLSLLILYSETIPYPGSSSKIGTKPRLKPFHFDQNIIDGQLIRIFCQLFDGSQPLSFQWLKDGQPLSSSTSSSSSSKSLLFTSPSTINLNDNHLEIQTFNDYSSLAISRVERRRDQGNYTCLVSNSYGSDQFSSMLIVQEPPSFLEKPHDISIGLKQSTFVMCRAQPSTIGQHGIKPVIKWNRIFIPQQSIVVGSGGTSLSSSAASVVLDKDARREQIYSGEQLHLPDIRMEDAGLYECVAENPHNGLTISHQFTVTVNVPAYFKTKIDQIEVKRGETAKLICEVFGAKPITLIWLRQNQQSGEFEPINLDYIPESFSFPRYTSIEKNFDPFFENQHHHHHHHSLNNNEDISSSSSSSSMDYLKPMPYVNNNRTLFELHINSVNSFDNGQYGCRARNDFGEDLRRINLFVQDVPASVRQIQLNQIWTNEASISWLSPETIGNSPITQYIVQYWKETRLPNSTQIISSGYRLHEIEIPSTETLCLIKNLTPGTMYACRVVAVNQFGRGQPSQLLRFQTVEEVPSASPIDITVEPHGTSALLIRWKAPPKSHWNGKLKGYYLGYRLISNNNGDANEMEESSNDIAKQQRTKTIINYQYKQLEFNGLAEENYQEEYLLQGLNKASLYGIILKCFNDVGESPSSHEILASTLAKDPPPKPQLFLVEAKENFILLKWDRKYSDEISHYVIFYKEEKRNKWMEIEIAKSLLLSSDNGLDDDQEFFQYKLMGLHRGTMYQIFLRSVGLDRLAMSEPSEWITVRTEGEVPLVSMLNSNSNEPQQPYHVAAVPTVFSMLPNAHQQQPTLATFQQSSSATSSSSIVPPYFRSGFIIPVAIAIVIIVIACVSAFVYIRIDDRNQQLKQLYHSAPTNSPYVGTLAVGPGKRFQYISPIGKSSTPNQSLLTNANTSGTPSSFNSSGGVGGSGVRDSIQSLVSEESSLSFRYSDSSSEKGRPLLSRPPMVNGNMMPTGVVWAQQHPPIQEEDEAIVDIDSSAYETLPFQKQQLEQQQKSTPMQSFAQQQQTATGSSNNSQFSVKSPPFPPPPPPLPGAIIINKSSSPLNKQQSSSQQHNIFCHVDVHHGAQSSNASDANNSDSYDEFHFFSPARV